MRVLGLDLGSKTCGVAISDVMGLIARAVEKISYEEDDYEAALASVMKHVKENQIHTVVLGLPRHMNGDVGIRWEISIAFKEMLEKEGLQVVLWDERLTTAAAQRILIAADVSRKKRKQVIDQMAAVQILQSYLDSK